MKVGIIICDRYRVGTHPVPEKYRLVHIELSSGALLDEHPELMSTQDVRLAYN